jgi:hypothetical protein
LFYHKVPMGDRFLMTLQNQLWFSHWPFLIIHVYERKISSRFCINIHLEDLRNAKKILRMIGMLTDIRTQQLQNMSVDITHYNGMQSMKITHYFILCLLHQQLSTLQFNVVWSLGDISYHTLWDCLMP